MKKLFVDTSAWDAIEDSGDANHKAAMLFKDEIANQCYLFTSDYILDETYTLLLMNIGHKRTVAFRRQLEILIKSHVLNVVKISEPILEKAWNVFEQYNEDKRWSFTDCTSYVVIEELSIDQIFSFDRHFEQMGFVRMP